MRKFNITVDSTQINYRKLLDYISRASFIQIKVIDFNLEAFLIFTQLSIISISKLFTYKMPKALFKDCKALSISSS